MAEVTAGIVMANLPPLRKSFDNLFKYVLPSADSNNALSRYKYSNHKLDSYNFPNYQSQITRSRGDGESDKAILEEDEGEDRKYGLGLMIATHIDVKRAF
jgi:hypothetical protein